MSPVRTSSAERTAELIRVVQRPHAFLNLPDSPAPHQGPLACAPGLYHFADRVDSLQDVDAEQFRHALQEEAGTSRLSELTGIISPPDSPAKAHTAPAVMPRNPQGSSSASSPAFSDDHDAQTVVGIDLPYNNTPDFPSTQYSAHPYDFQGTNVPYGTEWSPSATGSRSPITPDAIASSYALANAMRYPSSDSSSHQFGYGPQPELYTSNGGSPIVAPASSQSNLFSESPSVHPPPGNAFPIPSPSSHNLFHSQANSQIFIRPTSDSGADDDQFTSGIALTGPTQDPSHSSKQMVHRHPHSHQPHFSLGRMPSPSSRRRPSHDPRLHRSVQLYPHRIPTSSSSPPSSRVSPPLGSIAVQPSTYPSASTPPSTDAPQGYPPQQDPPQVGFPPFPIDPILWQTDSMESSELAPSTGQPGSSAAQEMQQQWFNNQRSYSLPGAPGSLDHSEFFGPNNFRDEFASFANQAMEGDPTNHGPSMQEPRSPGSSAMRRSPGSPSSVPASAGGMPLYYPRQITIPQQQGMTPGIAYPGQSMQLATQGNPQQFRQNRSNSYNI